MIAIARQAVFVALAGTLSWWLFLWPHKPVAAAGAAPPDELSVAIVPTPAPAPAPAPANSAGAPAHEPAEEPAAEPAPPPPELGDPDGTGDEPPAAAAPEEPAEPKEPAATLETAETAETATVADEPEPVSSERARDATATPVEPAAARPDVQELMADEALVATARREMSGEVRSGFATVFVSAPEDQLDLARAFGEELVLVPKAALDPEEPGRWYRLALDDGRVVPVDEPVPLERYTQYRDLFAFDYERLPEPLRALRRQVVARSDVYLFAALIPAAEWAVVIGRREEALARSARSLDEVRRFVLRAVRRRDGSFDFDVDEIAFADGESFHPSEPRR